MPKFTDTKSRSYTVDVTIGTAKRFKSALDVDLMEVFEDKSQLLARLQKPDLELVVDMLWLCCEKQASALNVSQDEFAESLAGDPLNTAIEALLEAIQAFFPDRRNRELLGKAMAAQSKVRTQAGQLVSDRLDRIIDEASDRELARVRSALDGMHGEPSTSSPVSPVSSQMT